MSIFITVASVPEYSERIMTLTSQLIAINPSHYTVWHYRHQTLQRLIQQDKDQARARVELDWVSGVITANKKNYQVWRYRQHLISLLYANDGGEETEWKKKELVWVEEILVLDEKNYHAWAYRQWMVSTYNMHSYELEITTRMLNTGDLRNNSVWNQRYWLMADLLKSGKVNVKLELEWCLGKIRKSPNNESPWAYVRALSSIDPSISDTIKGVCEELLSGGCQSLHLLSFLLQESSTLSRSRELTDMLCRVDPIRRRYWEHLYNQKSK
jgi:protein farnesyltransferase/geranylgeranyltransferase type-1 subunit alpha